MPAWLPINVFCIVGVLYIIYFEYWHAHSKAMSSLSFRTLLWIVFIAYVSDSFSRMYGMSFSESIYPVIVFMTYIKYMALPFIVPLFFNYIVHEVRAHDARRILVMRFLLWGLMAFNTMIVLSSPGDALVVLL